MYVPISCAADKLLRAEYLDSYLLCTVFPQVNQYDILLDVIVVNQTPDTLQNLTLELATLGDLKLTEKPTSHSLGPHDFVNIKANVKVSSTETGIIFGNIVYDVGSPVPPLLPIHSHLCANAYFRGEAMVLLAW